MKATLLALGAGLCWGIGEVCTKSVLHSGKVGPLTAIAVRSTVALPLLWLVWLVARRGLWGAAPEPEGWLHAETPILVKLVLGSGVLAGAIAMICFYSALKFGPVSQVKPIAFCLAPAVAVLLGWLVLGESMDLRKGVAICMILVGVVLLTGSAAAPAHPAH
ncbi:MAG: DMT family transporter [Phycisphaerales bacterium]